MPDTALLVIDIQNDYFPGGAMELEGADAAGAKAGAAIAKFRKNGNCRSSTCGISRCGPARRSSCRARKGAEIHASVTPQAGETVIEKNFPNSFRNTQLKDMLEKQGIKNLVVAGMMTHMCVDASVRHAADLGYKITLLGDACATRAQSYGGEKVPARQVHAAFLAALNGFYAKVVDTP